MNNIYLLFWVPVNTGNPLHLLHLLDLIIGAVLNSGGAFQNSQLFVANKCDRSVGILKNTISSVLMKQCGCFFTALFNPHLFRSYKLAWHFQVASMFESFSTVISGSLLVSLYGRATPNTRWNLHTSQICIVYRYVYIFPQRGIFHCIYM